MDWFNLPAKDRAFFSNVNGTLTSNESAVGCLEDTNFWTSYNLQSWLQTQSPSVTQTSVLYRFVFMNSQFAGNFCDSISDFNLCSLNGFLQKIFDAEAIEDDTSGPTSMTPSYSSVD